MLIGRVLGEDVPVFDHGVWRGLHHLVFLSFNRNRVGLAWLERWLGVDTFPPASSVDLLDFLTILGDENVIVIGSFHLVPHDDNLIGQRVIGCGYASHRVVPPSGPMILKTASLTMPIALARRDMPVPAVLGRPTAPAEGSTKRRATLDALGFTTCNLRVALATTAPPRLDTERIALDNRADDVICPEPTIMLGRSTVIRLTTTKINGRVRSGQVVRDRGAPEHIDLRDAFDTIAVQGRWVADLAQGLGLRFLLLLSNVK